MSYLVMYPQIPNMGDLLNKDMLEELFDIRVTRATLKNCNLIAIGSALDHTLYAPELYYRTRQKLIRTLNPEVNVWSSGFIRREPPHHPAMFYKRVNVFALRGALTRARMEKLLDRTLDVPLGDGGLLAQNWIGGYPGKKHPVGIIPHFKEQEHPTVQKLLNAYEGAVLIDLTAPPKQVVENIAQCELVISSSLHGLIVADSFHIPNLHITLDNAMFGDGNKFEDYYSAFGLEDKPFDCAGGELPALDEVRRRYRISADEVEEKKSGLLASFPKL